MAGAAKATTDHEELRKWAEERGGHPAEVAGTGTEGEPGMIRIEFRHGRAEENLKPISWEEWFQKFEAKKLAFLHQEQKSKVGRKSRFNKLVSRESAEERAEKHHHAHR